MDKFLLVFHSPYSSYSSETVSLQQSPEEIQAEIQKWNTWIGSIAAQGKMLSTEGLMPMGKIMKKGGQVITDGPYTEGKEIVGGYMVLTAATIDEAVELATGCPLFDSDGTVEVRPIINFG